MHKKPWLFFIVALLVTASCRLGGLLPPEVVNHTRPSLTVSMDAFQEAGCTPGDYGRWDCPPSSPVAALGCDSIATPSDLLGGLSPALPIAECRYSPFQHDEIESISGLEGTYFFNDGCMMPVYVRYAIYQDGEFLLLQDMDDLQKAFAPIDSPDEALSYALAATGNAAYFGFEAPRGYRYHVNTIEDTHVTATASGYEVLLYHYQFCGCGPHSTYAITVEVTTDGSVTERDVTPLFEDPKEDGLCVD